MNRSAFPAAENGVRGSHALAGDRLDVAVERHGDPIAVAAQGGFDPDGVAVDQRGVDIGGEGRGFI